ncbi:hypothetical protein [Chlorogloea sp. CCALA 695]|uniref:hypothetical protein n=1 Tax=Chlorogloea sp. CCALA 695 TaxID=2107693 RepID=UPI000D06AFC8|nr:hypothetical protein [Chlorogloea sp. CCALA 695]PSB27696.1 hypothetical protein C7B70_21910 [Chlorogloea sp. CCALA 695]
MDLKTPKQSLARQAWLYETLTSDYKELLTEKIALGENELEAQKLDLQAEPVSRLVLNLGNPNVDSLFTKPAYLVEVQAKTGAKPNTTEQVINAVRRELGFEPVADKSDNALFDVREKGEVGANQLVEQLSGSVGEYLARQIERHGKELYLTHYLADDYGDLFLDAEMVFNISAQGQLTLTQTASQNPLTGYEYRTKGDRSFGQIFSRNLIEQGFGKAALSAFQTKQQSASVQSPALVEVENLHQTASGLAQIPVEVENLQQTEAPQQLEKAAAVALKANEQPFEQAPTVATVVSNPIVQKVVEPSLQPQEVATKEPVKPKSSLKSSASTQVQIEAPFGVQLSLFDIGLNQTDATGLKSAPLGVIQAEKEPKRTANQVKESVQSVKETVINTQQVKAK